MAGPDDKTPELKGCLKDFRDLKWYLTADLYRYSGSITTGDFFRHFFFTPGYKYTVWMRLCGFLKVSGYPLKALYPIVKYILLRCRYKYGIAIPEYTTIGPGLFINRFGGIYVNGDAILGRNVNVTHGVVLGQLNRGAYAGSPVIGDRVFLGSGAKVIGRITLGNECSVGANAVVTKDADEGSVLVGVPAKCISHKGSEGYINSIHPDNL